MKRSLIQLRVNDKVIYEPEGRRLEMKIEDYQLVPNGINNPSLVCLISAVREDGFRVTATSDKFIIKDGEAYITVYENFKNK